MFGLKTHDKISYSDHQSDSFNTVKVDPMTFVLFGATGDLSKRKIFPTLYNLYLDNKIPERFAVIGLGRRNWSEEDFTAHVKGALKQFSRRFIDNSSELNRFLQMFQYVSMDVKDAVSYKTLLKTIEYKEAQLGIPENRLFYLSVAPEFIDTIALNILKSKISEIKGWKRLIIEKPFGHDLKSAVELNKKLSVAFTENEIYRVDHYLGKPMIQNIEALKFANHFFKEIINNKHISNVQITSNETVGVEGRSDYYDKAGAIRDMFQNHMMQMLMMTAMQYPETINANSIREEKVKVMKSLRPVRQEEIQLNVVRGQYTTGEVNSAPAVGYIDEPGIPPHSNNDTFIAARLWIDNPLWRGVPFYIRTGKRMKEKSTKIVFEFKKTEILNKTDEKIMNPNLLIIEISPNSSVSIQLNLKDPLNTQQIKPITIDFSTNTKTIPEAYEVLIFDAMRGDPTFFVQWEEVELSWKWLEVILQTFETDTLPLYHYSAGSMGPEAAHHLLMEDGFNWW